MRTDALLVLIVGVFHSQPFPFTHIKNMYALLLKINVIGQAACLAECIIGTNIGLPTL